MKWKLAVTALLTASTAAGAYMIGQSNHASHRVAHHRFAVPKDRIVDVRIAQLSPPTGDGFTFRLEDGFVSPRSHTVLVMPVDEGCRSPQTNQLGRIGCGAEPQRLPLKAPYKKVYPHEGITSQWEYHAVQAGVGSQSATTMPVASCIEMRPNPARPSGVGLCKTLWFVDGLRLSMHFDEDEVPNLASLRSRATAMLLSWEVD